MQSFVWAPQGMFLSQKKIWQHSVEKPAQTAEAEAEAVEAASARISLACGRWLGRGGGSTAVLSAVRHQIEN